MTDLLLHVELVKLAHDLGVEYDDVAFLDALDDRQVAALRGRVGHALFAPHEHRFARVAAMSKHVPATLAAKGAQVSLGPLIAGRVAAVTEPDMAVKLAGHMSTRFLARMTPHIDPTRVGEILNRLPEHTMIDVGRQMVADQEYIPLGRFVAHIAVGTALKVIDEAPAFDLLQVALYTDDRAALDRVIAAIGEGRLRDVLAAADEHDAIDDALTLLAALSVESRVRVVRIAGTMDDHLRNALVAGIARNEVWPALTPVLDDLGHDAALRLLDVPAMRDAGALDSLDRAARGPAGSPAAIRLAEDLRA